MATLYSGSEIIDIAKQMETAGEAFYDAASKHVKAPEIRRVFEYLRDEEKRHEALFEDILSRLELASGEWRTSEEYLSYLWALGQNRVFPTPEVAREVVLALPDETTAITYAIGFEKESILFFSELKAMVGAEDQQVIEELITEERKHLITLMKLRNDLS